MNWKTYKETNTVEYYRLVEAEQELNHTLDIIIRILIFVILVVFMVSESRI